MIGGKLPLGMPFLGKQLKQLAKVADTPPSSQVVGRIVYAADAIIVTGSQAEETAQIGRAIYDTERVHTGPLGAATIRLQNGNMVTIFHNSGVMFGHNVLGY